MLSVAFLLWSSLPCAVILKEEPNMETGKAKLTVLFDPPFWVGLFEREYGGRYEACRVVFGAEPRDIEVYACILDRYDRLAFSPALAFDP